MPLSAGKYRLPPSVADVAAKANLAGGNTFSGDQVGRFFDRGAVAYVSTLYPSLDDLLNEIGGATATIILAPGDTKTLTGNLTIPVNVTLSGQMGVIATNGFALTVNGPVVAGNWQVFDTSGGGSVVFGAASPTARASVAWWGVQGDGATPVQGTLNAIVSAMSGRGGGTVVVPAAAASYMVQANVTSLELLDNVTLEVQRGATIEAVPNASGIYFVVKIEDATNVRVCGEGTIKGDRAGHTGGTGESGMCIAVYHSTRVLIEDVTLQDAWGDGVYIGENAGGGCEDVWVRRCRIDNVRRNGVSVIACDGGGIAECHITGSIGASPESGIDLEPNSYGTLKNFVVKGNYVANCNGSGITSQFFDECQIIGNNVVGCGINGIQVTRSKYAVVQGNICRENGGAGIQLVNSTTAEPVRHCAVVGNITRDNTSHGIELVGVTGTGTLSGSNTVSGNTSEGDGGDGISISYSAHNVVANNTVRACGGRGIHVQQTDSVANTVSSNTVMLSGTDGIYVNSKWTQVQGNTIRQAGQFGISVAGDNNNIVGNFVSESSQSAHNNYANIAVISGTNNAVQANKAIMGGQPNDPTFGIRIEAGATGTFVSNNDVRASGATGNFSDAGVSTVTAAGNQT